MNPFAAAALAVWPSPDNGNPLTNRSNNLEETIPIKDYSDKYDAKLDYQIEQRMTSFLRFSQRKDISYYGPADPGPSGGDGNGFIHAIQQQAAIGYTWTVSPSSLLDARFRIRPRAGRQGAAVSGWTEHRSELESRAAFQPRGRLPHPGDRRIQQSHHRQASHQSAVPESDLL
jgi:hypothetical protein